MINKILYKKNLKRFDLLDIAANNQGSNRLKISIYRNHSFELIGSVINAFLQESNRYATFHYSDYDDSLTLNFVEADIHILWLDLYRYKNIDLSLFLSEKVQELRNYTNSPILVMYIGSDRLDIKDNPIDSYFLHINNEIDIDKNYLFDLDKESYFGTKLSNYALLEVARLLGLKYIPALTKYCLKCIVLDLDETLYSGILAEDGIKNLIPNLELQKQVKHLKEQGFLICLCSKNQEDDVKKLFNERADFILKFNDFSTVRVNWESKSKNIIDIAKQLNISTDAILFIDDNPAEIINVESINVNTLIADKDICQILKYYPGLLKLSITNEDKLRDKDIRANQERLTLSTNLSDEEYFKKLKIQLKVFINNKAHIDRVTELLNKTNQFIFNYKRYNKSDIKSFLYNKEYCVLTTQMIDLLSDSGIIAILIAHKKDEILVLDELTISCRALGRRLEKKLVLTLFKIVQEYLKTKPKIFCTIKKGPKNLPALKIAEYLCEKKISSDYEFIFNITNQLNIDGVDIQIIQNQDKL